MSVLYSTDDDEAILKSVEILREQLDNEVFREFSDQGHFVLGDMKTEEFPAILEEVL